MIRNNRINAFKEKDSILRGLFETMSSGVVIYEAVDKGNDFLILLKWRIVVRYSVGAFSLWLPHQDLNLGLSLEL